jgi:DNA-binding MarR family transcriptional regulator
MSDARFDLQDFLPYLLNQAAESASRGFQDVYRDSYNLTRTGWRVMANLGKFGAMTARDICAISHIEKTKVSRAISALQQQGLLARSPSDKDGRAEILSLTSQGQVVFDQLGMQAIAFDQALRARIGAAEAAALESILRTIIGDAGKS